MPFWLTAQFARNRAVAFAVMDLADEVAIMSYRTHLEELREWPRTPCAMRIWPASRCGWEWRRGCCRWRNMSGCSE